MKKITFIGAGSVVFARKVIGDLMQFDEFADCEYCLMDIDPDRLKVANILMTRMADALNIPAKVTPTLDRREAIQGASYVITAVQIGGYESTKRDLLIPAKYGLKQTIGDTLGIGGIFRGLRTIPVLVDIARDVEQHAAAGCMLLNYCNPMAMLCWGVDKAVGIPHVGLCHGVFGTADILCNYLRVPEEDLSYLAAGVNHMAFFLQLKYRGQDAYPLLFKALEDPRRDTERVRFEIMRRTGYFVCESSPHASEYLPYFIPHGEESISRFDIPINEYLRRSEVVLASWRQTEKEMLDEENSAIAVQQQSKEYAAHIIHSLETNTLRTIYGNVPNRGVIDNLQQGCCVEVPCAVDATGLRPVKIGNLPPQLAALCATQVNVQGLTVEAALSGKREHIYHAAMLDPNASATLTLDTIWAMCDELIEAHQKDGYLGEFTPVVKSTGRSRKGIDDVVIARVEQTADCRLEVGDRQEFNIELENRSDSVAEVELTPVFDSAILSLDGPATLRSNVEAGGTATLPLTFTNRVAFDKELSTDIDLRHQEGVLVVGAELKTGDVLRPDESGQVPFDISLGGFPAVSGKMSIHDGVLTIACTVCDSNVKVNHVSPHFGSCIEVFFATEERPVPSQYFILPAYDGKPALFLDRKNGNSRIESAVVEYDNREAAYDISVQVPLAELGLDPEMETAKVDVISRLMAQGDAHDGGRCSLSGHFSSFINSVAFKTIHFQRQES